MIFLLLIDGSYSQGQLKIFQVCDSAPVVSTAGLPVHPVAATAFSPQSQH